LTAAVAAFGLVVAVLAAGCAGHDEADTATPEQDRLAFASSRDGDFDIYVMDPSGGRATNLTANAGTSTSEADDDSPAWSPDGRWIAFTSTRDHEGDSLSDNEIYVMRADGSGARRIPVDAAIKFAPRWLPDGRLGYVACRDALTTCRVVARSLDGHEEETLAEGAAAVFSAQSPDGSRLALIRPAPTDWFDHPAGDIYVSDADGSDLHQLTDTPDAFESSPAWSPDGTRIAFVTDRDRNGDCLFHDCVGFASEIYVIDADGGDERRLTEFPGDDGFAVWSPDGEQILFGRIRDDDDDWELYVMNADGSCQTRLTNNDRWDWNPAWHGDGEGPISC
jgi:Tol biopolymer transport system component